MSLNFSKIVERGGELSVVVALSFSVSACDGNPCYEGSSFYDEVACREKINKIIMHDRYTPEVIDEWNDKQKEWAQEFKNFRKENPPYLAPARDFTG